MHTRPLRRALVAFSASLGLIVAAGCLSRPVVPGEPATKTNFTTTVSEQAVDKIDLLFSIDNSASMGDKQSYLEAAIPDLINALVTPSCVAADGVTVTGASAPDGTCSTPGSNPLFPPVHNMHIGVVSSSLGPRLGDQTSKGSAYGACLSTATVTLTENGSPVQVSDNNDDQAHLLTRASASPADTTVAACTGGNCPAFPTTAALSDAPEGFLDWFPAVAANTGKDAGAGAPQVASAPQLIADFSDSVAGIQQFGCGIESQLENWYRFLIQPDPYASLALNNGQAQWVGVDTTILQQRKDFLRPDSLVAIIVLTDENDSEIDVRSIGGQGYYFMSTGFNPPRGTVQCNSNPGDPNCISCDNASASKTDANCAMGPYTSPEDWGMDLNLRHVHMKYKYGLDPQYPITRYVTGLTSTVVPDRNGEYPAGASSYVGNNNCTNPLFAASLPDPTKLSANAATETTLGSETTAGTDANLLCKLPQGSRAPNLVFYTIIGGVPHQLLQDSSGNTKTTLQASDWVKIIGTDPLNFNYTGIDPHMVESYAPRNGTAADPNNVLAAPTSPNGTDPINGREWITNQGAHADLNVDREYACIFPLTKPRDCTDPNNKLACDCSTLPGVLTPAETSPVCDATTVTQQDYAKAYPTIRELILANKLGSQGIVASICPIDVTDNAAGTDPNYGYRPAVATIIDRLKNALTNQCLPQQLTPDPTTNEVPCLILVQLPPGQTSCNVPGLSDPDPQVLASFQQQAEQNFQQNGGADAGLIDPAQLTVCQANEIPEAANGSCKGDTTQSGWCYVTGSAAGTCQQAILFTAGFPPSGSKISLQCIEQSNAVGGDGG